MNGESLINPVREKNEPLLPGAGLLYINPPDAHRITSLLKLHQNTSSHFLFNSRLFTVTKEDKGEYFFAGPSIGAPMAVMTLEKLIALGAKKIIIYGWCGSLSRHLEIGSLLLPTWGIPGEGTSPYYPGEEHPASSEKLRNTIADQLAEKKIKCHTGPVWTTDAIYRETRQQLKEMADRSVVAVDMEFTALAKVASYRDVEMAAVYLVSDELWRENWVPGFKEPQFKNMNKKIIVDLLDIIQKVEAN